jgi:hypothetical protein
VPQAGSNDRVVRWLFRRLWLLYQPELQEPEKELLHTVIDLVPPAGRLRGRPERAAGSLVLPRGGMDAVQLMAGDPGAPPWAAQKGNADPENPDLRQKETEKRKRT